MVHYDRAIDLKSRDLNEKKIDDIVLFVQSLTSILYIPKIIQRDF